MLVVSGIVFFRGDKPWHANSGCHCIASLGRATSEVGIGSVAFFDYEIVGVFLWAVLHERQVVWACDPRVWDDDLRPRPLPSQSTISRRLRTAEVYGLRRRMERVLSGESGEEVLRIDDKPLVEVRTIRRKLCTAHCARRADFAT